MYSGMPGENDAHIRGVAVYVRKNVKSSILSWKAVSERIINTIQYNTLIQCYAPTEDSPPEQKKVFYSAMERTLADVPRGDAVILTGDFNAQIGSDNSEYQCIMGQHGIRTCNENGELLLELCLNNDLKIGGSMFPHKTCHKTTWKSHAGDYETQIDHICVSRRYSNSLCDVRNKRNGEIVSDHFLVVAELKLNIPKFRYTRQPQSRRTYNTEKLKADTLKNEMVIRISQISLPEDTTVGDTYVTSY